MITIDALRACIRPPYTLCSICAERYEEAASVMTEVHENTLTVHIKYPFYVYMPLPIEPRVPRRRRTLFAFGARVTPLLCGAEHAAASVGKHYVVARGLFKPEFIEYILEMHPELSGFPLTRSLLERLGVDLMLEEVMFNLQGGEYVGNI